MKDIEIEYKQADGVFSVVVPEQPKSWKWPVFLIVWAVFSVFLLFVGGWELSLLLSPLTGWAAAVLAFNRTELRIDSKRVEWKVRPFPTSRMKKVKREEIEAWLHGPTPNRGKGSDSTLKLHAVGILRKNGKIMRIADRFSNPVQAKELAQRCAEFCGLENRHKLSMRGPAKQSNARAWMLLAVVLFFAISIFVMLYQNGSLF